MRVCVLSRKLKGKKRKKKLLSVADRERAEKGEKRVEHSNLVNSGCGDVGGCFHCIFPSPSFWFVVIVVV